MSWLVMDEHVACSALLYFVHWELPFLALVAAAFLVVLTLGAVVDSSPRIGVPGFRVNTACSQS